MSTPYIGFGNDTLDRLPEVAVGDPVTCPKCGEQHVLEAATSTDGRPALLLFYKCAGEPYLGALNGRLVVGVPSDVSGTL